MATIPDPTQPATAQGIVNAAMQPQVAGSPATPVSSGIAPTSTTPAAPQPLGIVGAQSQQLNTPTTWNVTPDQTVEGRINNIINADSPFMQASRTRADEQMNARGLANTSLGITASETAAYNAALPIAQADAATASKAAGYNADEGNQFQVKNADYENQFALADKQNSSQMALADRQAQQAKDIALINRDTQTQLTTMDAQFKATADALSAQNTKLLQTNQQASQSFQQAVAAVSTIQNNNQMDAGTKTQAVAQVWRDLQTQLHVLGTVAGLDLTSQLNFANYPGFDANGNYVGFPNGVPGAPAPAPAPSVIPTGSGGAGVGASPGDAPGGGGSGGGVGGSGDGSGIGAGISA